MMMNSTGLLASLCPHCFIPIQNYSKAIPTLSLERDKACVLSAFLMNDNEWCTIVSVFMVCSIVFCLCPAITMQWKTALSSMVSHLT